MMILLKEVYQAVYVKEKLLKKIDVKNHISAQAAYEYCRNKTLWNSAKDRAYKAMPDSSFDTEIIQNKIRASIQETYGANELNSSSIFQGKWAIPDPQPNAEASDIIQKNWFSNEINKYTLMVF